MAVTIPRRERVAEYGLEPLPSVRMPSTKAPQNIGNAVAKSLFTEVKVLEDRADKLRESEDNVMVQTAWQGAHNDASRLLFSEEQDPVTGGAKGLMHQKGFHAKDLYARASTSMAEIEEKWAGGLNERQLEKFKLAWAKASANFVEDAAKHQATEIRSAEVSGAKASLEMIVEMALRTQKPAAFVREQAAPSLGIITRGLGDPERGKVEAEFVSGYHVKRAEGLKAAGAYSDAMTYIDAARKSGEMFEDDYNAAYASLRPMSDVQRNVADVRDLLTHNLTEEETLAELNERVDRGVIEPHRAEAVRQGVLVRFKDNVQTRAAAKFDRLRIDPAASRSSETFKEAVAREPMDEQPFLLKLGEAHFAKVDTDNAQSHAKTAIATASLDAWGRVTNETALGESILARTDLTQPEKDRAMVALKKEVAVAEGKAKDASEAALAAAIDTMEKQFKGKVAGTAALADAEKATADLHMNAALLPEDSQKVHDLWGKLSKGQDNPGDWDKTWGIVVDGVKNPRTFAKQNPMLHRTWANEQQMRAIMGQWEQAVNFVRAEAKELKSKEEREAQENQVQRQGWATSWARKFISDRKIPPGELAAMIEGQALDLVAQMQKAKVLPEEVQEALWNNLGASVRKEYRGIDVHTEKEPGAWDKDNLTYRALLLSPKFKAVPEGTQVEGYSYQNSVDVHRWLVREGYVPSEDNMRRRLKEKDAEWEAFQRSQAAPSKAAQSSAPKPAAPVARPRAVLAEKLRQPAAKKEAPKQSPAKQSPPKPPPQQGGTKIPAKSRGANLFGDVGTAIAEGVRPLFTATPGKEASRVVIQKKGQTK